MLACLWLVLVLKNKQKNTILTNFARTTYDQLDFSCLQTNYSLHNMTSYLLIINADILMPIIIKFQI